MPGEIELLEQELAQWLGAAGAVATGFGRGALALALETIGVEQADVLAPDFICAQVPAAVRWATGRPVPYPVERDLGVNPAPFRGAFTPKTKAAIVPHFFGRVQPRIEDLAAICHERGAALVEDCALALGARLGDRQAGTFGDAAVFSFTKSDWCYGGGAAVFYSAKWLEWARNLRARRGRHGRRRALCYGLLRGADWEANRPSRARLAEFTGRLAERCAAMLLPAFATGNFFDAGTMDAVLPRFAARRARGILRHLAATQAAQRGACQRLATALASAPGACRPFWARQEGESAAFYLLWAEMGSASELRERAAGHGRTLRLTWPAYEMPWTEPSPAVRELAGRLLFLEVHPRLSERETQRLVDGLQKV